MYSQQGFISGVPILSDRDIMAHVAEFDFAEDQLGPLHYRAKIHTVLTSALTLATLPAVLDVVSSLIGPDILLYNSMYIVKEPDTKAFVSLHQDLKYWGFSSDQLTSMWLALTPATRQSGCMSMVPGSHITGARDHSSLPDERNILYQSQTARPRPDEASVECPLAAGEASFHHGWTLHESGPNSSATRRIGLNVHYISPSMRKEKGHRGSALLVRGMDLHGNFDPENIATYNLEPAALAARERLEQLHIATAAQPNEIPDDPNQPRTNALY